MELLKYLQQWRTPFLDHVVDALTHLGDETFFMLAGLLLTFSTRRVAALVYTVPPALVILQRYW